MLFEVNCFSFTVSFLHICPLPYHQLCEVSVISGWACDQWQLAQETRLKTIIIFTVPFGDASDAETTCKKCVYGSQQQNVSGRCVWIKLVLSNDTIVWGLRLACHITRACVPRCQVFEVERCNDTLIQPRVFRVLMGRLTCECYCSDLWSPRTEWHGFLPRIFYIANPNRELSC